jgi:hypothetical protein
MDVVHRNHLFFFLKMELTNNFFAYIHEHVNQKGEIGDHWLPSNYLYGRSAVGFF